MDYLYDGTFDGFLTCVYHNYKTEVASGIYEKKVYQGNMFTDNKFIDTNIEYANKVYDAIEKKISYYSVRAIYYAFLSNNPEKEKNILNYIVFGFKVGKNIDNIYSHPMVLPVMEMSKKVGREAHRFLGYIRFADVNGILYAKCCPDNNILPIIAEHFADRYKYEKFVIYDEKRKIAVIYANNNWEVVDASNIKVGAYSKEEMDFQRLWKSYFETMAIKERLNDKLQTQLVPRRYRKNLVEFK